MKTLEGLTLQITIHDFNLYCVLDPVMSFAGRLAFRILPRLSWQQPALVPEKGEVHDDLADLFGTLKIVSCTTISGMPVVNNVPEFLTSFNR